MWNCHLQKVRERYTQVYIILTSDDHGPKDILWMSLLEKKNNLAWQRIQTAQLRETLVAKLQHYFSPSDKVKNPSVIFSCKAKSGPTYKQ